MTLSIIIAVLSVLALFGVLLMIGNRRSSINLDELRARLQPIDAAAFRNLSDQREEQFLREHLPPRIFRQVHRERMLAATEYVWCAAQNAGVLVRLAQAARSDQNQPVSAAASSLLETALQFRLHAYGSLPRLYARLLLPGVPNVSQTLAENCDRLSRQAVILHCLQTPDRGAFVR